MHVILSTPRIYLFPVTVILLLNLIMLPWWRRNVVQFCRSLFRLFLKINVFRINVNELEFSHGDTFVNLQYQQTVPLSRTETRFPWFCGTVFTSIYYCLSRLELGYLVVFFSPQSLMSFPCKILFPFVFYKKAVRY